MHGAPSRRALDRGLAARSVLVTSVLTVAFALPLAACGSDDAGAPDRRAFAARLAERTGLEAADARCVTSDAYRTYEPDELRAIYDHGLDRLEPARWSPYVQAFASCVLAPEGPS